MGIIEHHTFKSLFIVVRFISTVVSSYYSFKKKTSLKKSKENKKLFDVYINTIRAMLPHFYNT